MRDVLSVNNNIPIQLYKKEGRLSTTRNFRSRRILSESDINIAFEMARVFEVDEPKLLRAIGWYSKGKLSNNTFNQFFSFWNVIEILATEYHTPTERTRLGVVNKAYQCFIDYFGEVESWNLPNLWIDAMYNKRNQIFHGGADINMEAIKETSKMIPLLEETSRRLINEIIDDKYGEYDFDHFEF